MSSFDKSMPIVNPRRYLKVVDYAESVLTDAEVKERVENAREKEATPPEHAIVRDTENVFEPQICRDKRIAMFLRRFFVEIRNVGRDQLMQIMDDKVHSTFGIFMQTAKAQSFVEYQELNLPEKTLIDKLIAMWKGIEDIMRSQCIDEIQYSPSIHAEERIGKFANLLRHAEQMTENASIPGAFTLRERLAIKNALTEISYAYADMLDCTAALETAITVFVLNTQSILNQSGVPISLSSIIEFPIPSDVYAEKIIDINTMAENTSIQKFVYMHRGRIREWFRNLNLTRPDPILYKQGPCT